MQNTNKHLLLFLLLAGALSAPAQTVNWANDIAPILYEHCVKCHRDGGIGHFSLIGYGSAFSNRYAIQDKTETRQMPPWKPDPAYRHFAGENLLTQTEIQTIKSWVDAGAPAGDLSQAPPDPVFQSGSDVGTPDLVLHTPLYTVTATEDEYRCFVVPSGLLQAAYLRGLEVIPGNHEAVHHVLIYQDTTGEAKVLDAQTPAEPGYVNFGGPGVQGAKLVGAWVPGASTRLTPAFMGVRLAPGADLIVQVHFPAGATGMSEMSTLNLFFTPTNKNIRELSIAPLLNHSPFSLEGFPLNIPANTVKNYHAKYTVPINGSVVGVGPHMHLIGRSIESYGVTPQGDTIPLIRIPEWDFHWQGFYMFQKVQKVPFGTKLHAYATYDNTLDNPFNPSDPPKNVVQGEATTDEMMLVYFTYMQYQSGDENIVLDSTLLSTAAPELQRGKPLASLRLSPNPATDHLTAEYELTQSADVQASITDANGRVLKIFAMRGGQQAGIYRDEALLSDLPPGLYFIQVRAGAGSVLSARFFKE